MAYREIREARENQAIIAINRGGTSSGTRAIALANLGGVPSSALNIPGGIVVTNDNNKIDRSFLPKEYLNSPSITGATLLAQGQTENYVINDYDMSTNYSASVSSGMVSVLDDTITFTAPMTDTVVTLTVNGYSYFIAVGASSIVTPNIVAPVNGFNGGTRQVWLMANSFNTAGVADSHEMTDWEVSVANDFSSTVFQSLNNSVNKTSIRTNVLAESTTYYVRVRYKGVSEGWSAWSPTVSFSTRSDFSPQLLTQVITKSRDSAALTAFGYMITMTADGKKLAIGEPLATVGGFNVLGAIHLYEEIDGSFIKTEEIVSPASSSNDIPLFSEGLAYSRDGKYLAYGSYGHNNWNGKVWVRGPTGTSEIIPTRPPGVSGANSGFGARLAISADGSTLAVSASGESYNGHTNVGAVYIFTRSGSTWSQMTRIPASVAQTNLRTGYQLVISDDGLTIAFTQNKTASLFVYQLITGTWTLDYSYSHNDLSPDVNEEIFLSIAMSGDGQTIMSGFTVADSNFQANMFISDNMSGNDYVKVFKKNMGSWSIETDLTHPNLDSSSIFGTAISLSKDGKIAFIRAIKYEDNDNSVTTGYLLFSKDSGSWMFKRFISTELIETVYPFRWTAADESGTKIAVYLTNTSGLPSIYESVAILA